MALAIELQILDAIAGALRAAWIYPDRVHVFRGFVPPEEQLPMIDVTIVSDDASHESIHSEWMEHRAVYNVDVVVREAPGESIAHTADPIVQLVHQTIRADAALAALVLDIGPPRRDWVDGRQNGGVLRLRTAYEIEFLTQRDDLASAP